MERPYEQHDEEGGEQHDMMMKRTELESRGVALLQTAIKHDVSGEYDRALEQYETALHCLVELSSLYSQESEEALLLSLHAKTREVADRAETLRAFLNEQQEEEKGGNKKEDEAMRECEEILQIEGVQCLHIHDGEQDEAGRGTLRILKVVLADEEIRSHKHLFREFTPEQVNGREVIRLTFLALGEYQLPLIPGLPCLRTTPLSFLLPMQQEGHYAAYIFPSNIPPIYTEIFERKMREICEVKHSYGEEAKQQAYKNQTNNQQPYTVQEVDDEDDEQNSESRQKQGSGKVIIDQTKVGITNDDGHSWEVTNEVITFSSDAKGQITPYKPFDYTPTVAEKTASYLDYVAAAVEAGGAYLSDRLEKGSGAFAQRLVDTVEYAKENGWITPNQEEMKVNPLIKGTINYGSRISPIAVTASGAVVSGLVYAAEGVGKLLGRGVAAAVPKGKGDGNTYAPVRAAVDLGSTTVRSAVSVWEALENAGSTVLAASSGATVSVVKHKYGSEAAETLSKSYSLGSDVFETVSNVRSLGVKKIAKKAAKKSGVQAARTVIEARTDASGKPLAIEYVATTPTIEFPLPDNDSTWGNQQRLLQGGEQYRPLLSIEDVSHGDDNSLVVRTQSPTLPPRGEANKQH